MAPTLYMIAASPPVRATIITAKAIGLELNLVVVNLFEEEHKKPEYLKINPQHTVPTLVDEDGFAVWDSHAIIPYIVSKYGKDDSLYPKDLKKRALIDQRLHFDSGVLFPKMVSICRPIYFGSKTSITDADKETAEECYAFLEAFLAGREWVANELSIADYTIVATISSFELVIPIDASKYPRLSAWLKKATSLPEFAVSIEGLNTFKEMITAKTTVPVKNIYLTK